MPSALSITGSKQTGRTSFFEPENSDFPDRLSLSGLATYETCYETVNPRQSFVAVGYQKGHFTYGYDPKLDRLQFVSISEAYAKDDGQKISQDTVVLGLIDLDEEEEQVADALLELHYEKLGKPFSSEAAGSKEDQEAAMKAKSLRLARQLKGARQLQWKEKEAESELRASG